VAANRQKTSRDVIDAIFAALHDFQGDAPAHDDMTAVVLKITA
jgi:serine phosphatase RsbU (regulator of sigma subunit)